jgi:3-dehydrocarnitine:acetyl-CoA trimethylamine transferase
MARKVIITCALTGGAAPPASKHPGLPFSPEEIAVSAIGAARAGAAIVHVHVRDPETGIASMAPEYYREVVERVRAGGVDVLINLTTGAGGRFVPGEEEPAMGAAASVFRTPETRVRHVEELRPDICSLDMGSMNFGASVFVNTPDHLTRMAEAIRAVGVKPELEVFDSGHLRLAARLIADGVIDAPAMFQLCLGISWGEAATPEAMMHLRDQLPPGSLWAGFGIAQFQFPMVAQAVVLGGHVRVGLEDNLYLSRGVPAPDNAALVARAVDIIGLLGDEVASPDDAREILAL